MVRGTADIDKEPIPVGPLQEKRTLVRPGGLENGGFRQKRTKVGMDGSHGVIVLERRKAGDDLKVNLRCVGG